MTARNWVISVVACLAAAGSLTLGADTGGGSGKPMTPYKQNEKLDESRVQAARLTANTMAALERVQVNGTSAGKTGYKIGFVCGTDRAFTGMPQPRFHGTNAAGALVNVDFADVESFELTSVTASDAVLSITQFPALSPKELLKLQPTFTQLQQGYRRVFPLKVSLACDGGELAVAGTDWDTETTYKVLFRLREVRQKTPVMMRSTAPRGGQYWWAIPSVTADTTYPHRVVTKS